jgi:CheY-like chemotaxis protein
MARRGILVADVPQAQRAIAECLPGRELTFVNTLPEAKLALAGGDYDMIVVGVQFYNSQAFALLSHLRSRQRYTYVPVVCVRALPHVMPRELSRVIEEALRMLGATALIDIDGTNHREVCRRLKDIADHPHV